MFINKSEALYYRHGSLAGSNAAEFVFTDGATFCLTTERIRSQLAPGFHGNIEASRRRAHVFVISGDDNSRVRRQEKSEPLRCYTCVCIR